MSTVLYANSVLANAPILYWKMDDISPSALNTVFTITDYSGFARHFAYSKFATKPITNQTGAFSGDIAYRLTSAPANYSTSAALLRGGVAWTVEWWFKAPSSYTFPAYLWAMAAQGTGDGEYVRVEFHTDNSRGIVVVTGNTEIINDQGDTPLIPASLPLHSSLTGLKGAWHYCALRYDGAGTLALFRDSRKITEVARTISLPATGNFQFRLQSPWGTQTSESIFASQMWFSEIAIFDTALSDETLTGRYTAYDPRTRDVGATAIVVSDYAPLVSRGHFEGGERVLVLDGADRGQFRLWLGGSSPLELPPFTGVGVYQTVGGDAFLPLEMLADSFITDGGYLEVYSDAFIPEDHTEVSCSGYVVSEGNGRSLPLPPAGRARPTNPSGRSPAIP